MISVNIIFKNSSVTLPLNFKSYKTAEGHRKTLAESIVAPIAGILKIEDDYGTIADIDSGDIASVVLIDLHRELDRQGEYGVMQALSQKKSQDNYAASQGKILKPVMPLVN